MTVTKPALRIESATERDVPVILRMIKGLAEYEQLGDHVIATEEKLRATLFGPHPAAEVLIGYDGSAPVGFALFFQVYSTFLAQPGIYLEDLFVVPEARAHGYGRQLLAHLARVAAERGCGRLEWSVLDWNQPAIGFYKKLGAIPMEDWTIFRLTGDALTHLAQQP
jgi:GNAT superfamily N-acetyltransferase